MLAVLVSLLAASIFLSEGSQRFTCSMRMRKPSMPNAYVNGVVSYDWTAGKMRYHWVTSDNYILWQHNSGKGYSGTSDQFHFSWSPTCPCSVKSLNKPMPPLFADSNRYSGSTELTPIGSTTLSGITSLTLDASGFPKTSQWDDGSVISYGNCQEGVASDAFNRPSNCNCGSPLDIVLVLDRSSSISMAEGLIEKDFTQKIVQGFTYGPKNVNLGITNFHTRTWDGPVELVNGRDQQSVYAGANALQCWSDSLGAGNQCKPHDPNNMFWKGSSCCGAGTCISCGLINGADMLATPRYPAGSIRSTAQKVIILFTDGYHNLLLQRDANGGLIRDPNGKPSGKALILGGTQCTEQNPTPACATALDADLQYAVDYAARKAPGVKIFVVAVGEVYKQEQLTLIAQGKQSHTFSTRDWSQLTSLVASLLRETCSASSESTNACGTGCCGFCACDGCKAPDGCDNNNKCTKTAINGLCCSSTPVPPSTCELPDKCYTYNCDPAINGGAGGCTRSKNPLKANTTCAGYNCNPVDGSTVYTNLCPCTPPCKADADCASLKTACNKVTCTIDPADACKNKCTATDTSATCQKGDKCFTDSCDPKIGCKHIPITPPANTTCFNYTCKSPDGTFNKIIDPKCIACKTTTDCDDKDMCTDDSCVVNAVDVTQNACVHKPKAANFCDKSNQCFTYSCDPAKGCVNKTKPLPPDSACAKFTCNPADGSTITTYVGSCIICDAKNASACDDKNVCTDDSCEINADPTKNSCKNTAKPTNFCQGTDKCFTYSCDPVKGCVNTSIAIPEETTCTHHTCVSPTGDIKLHYKESCITCKNATTCDDSNVCTVDTCETDPADPTQNKCVNRDTTSDCTKTDKCFTYSCDPKEGCKATPVTVPNNTECFHYKCDTATGEIITLNQNCTPPVCTNDTDCNDGNACTEDKCDWPDRTDNKTAKCLSTPKDVATCDDKNACTTDSCDPTVGCVNEPFPADFCNDNNNCTIDKCDPLSTNLTFPCVYTPCNCTPVDVCHNAVCDVVAGCQQIPIVCPHTDNCTVSGCNTTNQTGCYIKTAGNCSAGIIGLAAGIAAGAMAGIIVAAVIGAFLFSGGAAYAFTQAGGPGLGAGVANNPIYQASGDSGHNPLFKV